MSVSGAVQKKAAPNLIGEAQISIEVADGGAHPITGETSVNFTIHVSGPVSMIVTKIYFDGAMLSRISDFEAVEGDFLFKVKKSGGKLKTDKDLTFVAQRGLLATAKTKAGLDAGESMTINVSLKEGFTFADALEALVDGSIRIGLTAKKFDTRSWVERDDSPPMDKPHKHKDGSFISNPIPPIPAPGAVALAGLLGLAGVARRRR